MQWDVRNLNGYEEVLYRYPEESNVYAVGLQVRERHSSTLDLREQTNAEPGAGRGPRASVSRGVVEATGSYTQLDFSTRARLECAHPLATARGSACGLTCGPATTPTQTHPLPQVVLTTSHLLGGLF
jgi:hypothetical protein